MEPLVGIHRMTYEQYAAAPGVRASDLKLVRRSPKHFWQEKLNPRRKEKKTTKPQLLGRASHCGILEPSFLMQRYCAAPEDAPADLRRFRDAKKRAAETDFAIEWWDQFESENVGKTVLASDDLNDVIEMVNAVRANDDMHHFLSTTGESEVAIFAVDPETGLQVKCMVDRLCHLIAPTDGRTITTMLDLKSTDDARPKEFSRVAYNMGYFLAAPYYMDIHEWAGLGKVDTFLIPAIETDPPYATKLYEIVEKDLQRGRAQYRQALNTYSACLASGDWTGYSTDLEALTFPDWAKD